MDVCSAPACPGCCGGLAEAECRLLVASENLELSAIRGMFFQPRFLIYFAVTSLITYTLFVLGLVAVRLTKNPDLYKRFAWVTRINEANFLLLFGISSAASSGLIASQTLLFGKCWWVPIVSCIACTVPTGTIG